MPRIRTIKPEFFLDEDLARLDPLDRLTFVGLWTQADRAGRLEDRPERLRIQILPYDNGDVTVFDARLTRLQESGHILRYQVAGVAYIVIPTFLKHQRPHHTEQESVIPPPPPLDNGCATGNARQEGKGKEGKGKEGKKDVCTEPDNGAGSMPTNLAAWLLGSDFLQALADPKHARFWAKCEQLYDAYPWLYFEDEIRKADLWLTNHPHRRPTERGLPRFFASWLERAVDIGRRKAAYERAPNPPHVTGSR